MPEIPVDYDGTVDFDLQSMGSYSSTYQEKICEDEIQVSNIG